MGEIRVSFDEAAPVLNRLKQQARQLESNTSLPSFGNTKLELTDTLIAIEEKYQQMLKNYQTILLRVTDELDKSLEEIRETDQHVSHQIQMY